MKKFWGNYLSSFLVIFFIGWTNPLLGQPPVHIFDVNISGTATLKSYGGYSEIYFYEYELTFATNNTKAISHWSLELSACVDDNDLLNPTASTGTWTYTKPYFNEPVLGYHIYGIKWDAGSGTDYKSGTFTFSFYSLGKPMTVNWYAKDGTGYEDNGTTIGPNCDDPIPVELTSFAAQTVAETVTLTWATATETENLGFHIYRNMTKDGEYTKITQELIPGAGSSDKTQTYSYTDREVKPGKTYYYKLADVDFNGNINYHGPISVTVELKPTKYMLAQNFPNPFNPETAISFALKETGYVTLKIYNVQGQLIRTLVDEEKPAGHYSIMWNGTDKQGAKVSSGTYLYTLKINGFEETKKLIFMK